MNLGSLVSETRNPQTMDLDALSTLELVNRFNQQDTLVAQAVKETLPEVAKAVDAAAEALKAGGRIIYMGAGTSGRLGVLDASECPPTFGVPHGLVVGLIAGGPGALLKAVEGAEDNKQLGEDDLKGLNLTAQDLVVGLAASGRTPYVIGGLEYANKTGCTTVAISCNPGSPIAQVAAIAISPVVGPEALTGSTRLKSGTAQKLVLNMISTGAMVKFGKVYQNLMVDMLLKRFAALTRQTHKRDIQLTLRQHRRQRRHIGFYLVHSHRHVLQLILANKGEDFGVKGV